MSLYATAPTVSTSFMPRSGTCCSTAMGGSAQHALPIGCTSTKLAMLCSHRDSNRYWTISSRVAGERAKTHLASYKLLFAQWDRGFESDFLQRGVKCELELLARVMTTGCFRSRWFGGPIKPDYLTD